MGHDLYREVKAGMPPEWDPAMHLIALLIADAVRDGDPNRRTHGYHIEGWADGDGRWHDGLTEESGMEAASVRGVLERLGRAGYEMRVPITTGKNGRPVFAAKSHKVDFVVPPLEPRQPPPQSRDEERAFERQSRDEERAYSGQRRARERQSRAPERAHLPGVTQDQNHPSRRAAANGQQEATDADVRRIIKSAKTLLGEAITSEQARYLIDELRPDAGYRSSAAAYVAVRMERTPDRCRDIIAGNFVHYEPGEPREVEPPWL